MSNVQDLAVVLQVSDIERSLRFYRDVLGFKVGMTEGDPAVFAIIRREKGILFLDQSREEVAVPVNQYWAAYLWVDDAIDDLATAFRAKGATIIRGPDTMPYGCRDFDVRDPDGHLIAFGQDLMKSDAG